eukprot:CAMPEP_0119317096 /NCGR_PEP_ID=MMETSP1333-20130426/41963_1 /TAXON_ID=418940 /ORGANISM="Scyphosphaera apsteinii, Strain RCC1455" /LENGTH=78 /DNA_ID=CAMNT_0007322935 /DNA_START=651 /DNA_END=888 /DNA_ORIENTATION=+
MAVEAEYQVDDRYGLSSQGNQLTVCTDRVAATGLDASAPAKPAADIAHEVAESPAPERVRKICNIMGEYSKSDPSVIT